MPSRRSAARLERRIGETLTVLVDAHERTTAIARSAADAPEIDGQVRIAAGGHLAVGEFAQVTVTGTTEHDLKARVAR
jgi:ribosomal protein S12 methylthiotransferase